jgi:hypothetical protein
MSRELLTGKQAVWRKSSDQLLILSISSAAQPQEEKSATQKVLTNCIARVYGNTTDVQVGDALTGDNKNRDLA